LDCITTTKECADQLAVIGKPVDDDDLITYLIVGLNSAFNPLIASFSFATRENNLTLEDFQAELLSYEALLKNQNKSIPPDSSQVVFLAQNRGAHYPRISKGHPFKPFPKQFSERRQSAPPSTGFPRDAQHGIQGLPYSSFQGPTVHSYQRFTQPGSHRTTQHGSSSNKFSPNGFQNAPWPPCQICGESNHQALDCYHRMDFSFQGRHHPPSHLAAMVANTSVLPDNKPWYAGSGANQHITYELDNLTLQQSYNVNETVSVGNGAGLLIANIGSSFFNTLHPLFV
jgi:hypothetical protein